MAFPSIRTLRYQNPSSGRLWAVVFKLSAAGAVTAQAQRLGVNVDLSDHSIDNTEATFVVVTAQVGKVFGTDVYTDSALSGGTYYHASNPASAAALLSTLLA